MRELPDLVLAYGNSDEFRYVSSPGTLFERYWRSACASIRHTQRARGIVFQGGADVLHSFVFHKDCVLFERRARYGLPFSPQSSTASPVRCWSFGSANASICSKLSTTVVSTFTSYYTFLWPAYFPTTPLTPPLPSFDGRAICYPSDQNLRDYMSWRQVDCKLGRIPIFIAASYMLLPYLHTHSKSGAGFYF